MSDHSADGAHASHPSYVKIYLVLVVLFLISVMGPEVATLLREASHGTPEDMAHRAKIASAVVLITAFGIAIVKAILVGGYFMHLKYEPGFARWLLYGMMAFLLVFFAGVAPDVMKHEGANWRHIEVVPDLPQPHGGDHGEAAAGHGDAGAAAHGEAPAQH